MKKIIAIVLTISFILGSVVSSFSNNSNTRFADNADIADYARDAVNWAVNNNIITGYENNTFRPRVNMEEAHWTIILTRFVTLGQIPAAKSGEHWADPAYKVAQDLMLPFKGLNTPNIRANAINRGDVARTIAAAYGFNLTLEQAVEFMYDNEFSVGTDPSLMNFSTYGVNSNLTRQDAVVFIQRISDLVQKRGGVTFRGTFYSIQHGNAPGIKNGGRTFTTAPDWSRFSTKSTSETISDVTVLMRNNKPEIRVKTTNSLTYRVSKLESTDKTVIPDRLVFDFDDAKFEITNKSKLLSNNTLAIDVNNEIVRRVRASQFEVSPFKTRVVLEVNRFEEYRVYYDDVNKEMVISFNLNDNPPVNRGEDRDNILNSITMNYIQNRETLFLEGLGIDDINISKLDSPNRLVIDIKNAEIATSLLNSSTINLNGRVAKTVRVSQFNNTDKVARVVVDLFEQIDINDFTFEISKNNIAIYLEKINQAIVYQELDSRNSSLTIRANQVTNYTTNYDQLTNTLIVTVPKSQISLATALIQYNDSFIQFVNTVELNNQYRLEIKLQNNVEHRLVSPLDTRDMVIQFNRQGTKYSDILIVIDPGHGGRDPGAISPILKIYESNLVLDVSQRLNKLLQDAGFRTYMTRTGDTTISNQERAEIANQLGANLFVSVHANAAKNSNGTINTTANGIETFYYPSENDPNDNRDNRRFAQLVQAELVRSLQANNRGVKTSTGLIVTRETKMPAILCELGFLTNPGEEAKLATSEYRQKAAEAMFNGIVKYFE